MCRAPAAAAAILAASVNVFKKEIDVHFKQCLHRLKNATIGKFYIDDISLYKHNISLLYYYEMIEYN